MLNIKKHLYLHYYLVFSVLYMTELTKNRFYFHVLMAITSCRFIYIKYPKVGNSGMTISTYSKTLSIITSKI